MFPSYLLMRKILKPQMCQNLPLYCSFLNCNTGSQEKKKNHTTCLCENVKLWANYEFVINQTFWSFHKNIKYTYMAQREDKSSDVHMFWSVLINKGIWFDVIDILFLHLFCTIFWVWSRNFMLWGPLIHLEAFDVLGHLGSWEICL